MRKSKNLLVTVTLMAILTVSVSTVRAGILMTDSFTKNEQTCTETRTKTTSFDWGVIVQGIKGVIVQGLTGVIVQGVSSTNTECGVIVQG